MANNNHVPWPQRMLSEVLEKKSTSDVLVGKGSLHPQHEAFFFIYFKEYFWHESLEGDVCQSANMKNKREKKT